MGSDSTPRKRTAAGRGRPRIVEQRRDATSAREEILDAAAELFTTSGYAGTSTRRIADAVGIRQASLYHHFATKDDILIALLQTTVEPQLERARALLDDSGPALHRLLSLARFDMVELVSARWNLGVLYLLPELRSGKFDEFLDARRELAAVYTSLAGESMGDPTDMRALLPFRLVESVIMMRDDDQHAQLGSPTAAELVDTLLSAIERLLS